jgi:hypothetical protein
MRIWQFGRDVSRVIQARGQLPQPQENPVHAAHFRLKFSAKSDDTKLKSGDCFHALLLNVFAAVKSKGARVVSLKTARFDSVL